MRAPGQTLDVLSAEPVAELLAAAADIALVLDHEGTIRDLALGSEDPGLRAATGWLGKRWAEVATTAGGDAIASLLSSEETAMEGRTVCHRDASGAPVPVHYRVVRLDSGYRAALGRDLRPSPEPHRQRRGQERLRSIEQTTALVGQVPLRDLVREATDLIERMCIETALHATHNNRASAAELLGLSRQSLYSKLRRHGLMASHHDAE